MPAPAISSPIVTITLNPALDLSAEVARVTPGPKLRTGPVLAEPGGGGINVARAVASLGGEALALAALAGANGARLAGLLERVRGLALAALPAPGETRESLSVTETESGAQYRFVLPGPEFAPQDCASLIAAITKRVPAGAFLVLSGSQPPGLPDDLPQRLAGALPPDTRLILDISGPPLTRLIDRPDPALAPYILRMDAAEAEAQMGRALDSPTESVAAAAALVARGVARCVILARGAEGSVLADDAGAWICAPPPVSEVSKVGAGDSFVAGLTLALARGEALSEALRLATAAAAAAVMTPGSELCRATDVERLLPDCRLSRP